MSTRNKTKKKEEKKEKKKIIVKLEKRISLREKPFKI